jgi:hypothetical protein
MDCRFRDLAEHQADIAQTARPQKRRLSTLFRSTALQTSPDRLQSRTSSPYALMFPEPHHQEALQRLN